MGYKEYQEGIAPPRFQGPAGLGWFTAHGQWHDALVTFLQEGVQARFPSIAPEDALAIIGAERGLSRYPNEALPAWRNRVQNAFEFWALAGTIPGVKQACLQMGYRNPQVIEHFHAEPAAWSEFSVVIYPGTTRYTSWKYGPSRVYGEPGLTYGINLDAAEKSRVRSVLEEIKPAHTKLRTIYYVQNGAVYGAFHHGDGTVYGGEIVEF